MPGKGLERNSEVGREGSAGATPPVSAGGRVKVKAVSFPGSSLLIPADGGLWWDLPAHSPSLPVVLQVLVSHIKAFPTWKA